ncbi:MAG TPA: arginine deiminase-related protein [Chitinophagaceae bacterium]|nr:arginine deiminase-related protein [Chitinophagaceae bacterium]
MQTTSHILMIRPVRFGYNTQTAESNAFQINSNDEQVQEKALKEFDAMVDVLRKEGVDVMVIDDTPEPHTPDSIFPNNWISFHEDASLFLYPMFAENRRKEIRKDIIEAIKEKFTVTFTHYFNSFAGTNEFLEGTGSMVLDRDKKIAYACRSPRTNIQLFKEWCEETEYTPVVFHALDENDHEIYHTNVMMCVGDRFVVICLECIKDDGEREEVIKTIRNSGKKIIEISYGQVKHFAGNMLQVENAKGEKLLVLSSQAYLSLTNGQKNELTQYNRIVHSPLTTIENNGGGSARCMMAEIHLPLR